MKSNLISAIAGWKSAALLALVAMVAAVAFSGVLTNTQTAEAQATPSSAPPGSTVVVSWPAATGATPADAHRFRIDSDSDGTATFSNGAQSITCYVGSPTGCDASTTDAGIQLRVTIDADSPLGSIFVQLVTRTGGDFTVGSGAEHIITVIPANPAVAIRSYGAPNAAAIPAAQPATGVDVTLAAGTVGTVIGSQLVNARGAGIAGTNILVTTTRGVLNSTHVPDTTPPTTCVSVSACTLVTQAATDPDGTPGNADDTPAGIVQVRLTGNGATGSAAVTFRDLGSGLTRTVNVVMHGPAASISAAADQSTIAGGGSTFIVVTVLDADGNPAVGVQDIDFRTNKPLVQAIVGPEVPAGSAAVVLDYSRVVDRDLPGAANDLPSCGMRAAVEDDASTTDVNEAKPGSNGTNTAGKCVIQVTAAGGDTPSPADDSTRGTHTLTVGSMNARIPTVTVEIQVGGAPASIEHDAPERVDSLSTTKITVTVMDDEGVRVGAVPITVTQVEGSGNADPVAGGMTSDGRASFTFLAPLTPGEAVFLIRAGAPGKVIQDTVTLAIGPEPEMDDMDDMEDATWNKELVSGQNLVVWNGADGADPSDGATDGVQSIWSYNAGAGTWDGYFADAADVPGGNTLTSLTNGDAYWVIVE